MTKPETPGYRFVAVVLGVDARERPNLQPDGNLGWWREFWTAMAGRAGAVDDFARSRPNPDQAAPPESRNPDDPNEAVMLESPLDAVPAKQSEEDAPAEAISSSRSKPRRKPDKNYEEAVTAQRVTERLAATEEVFIRSGPSLLRHLLARRHARQLEYRNQVHNQELAWRVQDIIAGLGLSQINSSVGGGRTIHIPQVVSVAAGPPMGLTIRTLPGQMPDDFAAHAPAIAYNLGVAEVQVIPLGPSLIRLDLLPGSD